MASSSENCLSAPDDTAPTARPWHRRSLSLILAGATWRDRARACLGAALGVGGTGLICSLLLGDDPHLPLLVAPMGASALLLFVVPASPMAQPWPVIGGSVVSAAVGLAVAGLISEPALAAGLAVAISIAAMSLARCLHPPGSAVALTAALGGPAVATYGPAFALVPVGLNAVVLTLLGWAFHRLSTHSYPHVPPPPVPNLHGTRDLPARSRVGVSEKDIDEALADLGETFDIDRSDLGRLLRRIELRALERTHGGLTCADIMSRDIVHASRDDALERVRQLLLDHQVRTLPVLDEAGRVLGSVGLRELTKPGDRVCEVMSPALTALPGQRAVELTAPLTDGQNHAVVIVDDDDRLLGLVTQTDLLAKLLRPGSHR